MPPVLCLTATAKPDVTEDIARHFREVLRRAVELLRGEGLLPEEADELRERLLAGFRWILVDEYQDVGPDQYELISALVGCTREDEDGKLNLFAVGDDDQNIYASAPRWRSSAASRRTTAPSPAISSATIARPATSSLPPTP